PRSPPNWATPDGEVPPDQDRRGRIHPYEQVTGRSSQPLLFPMLHPGARYPKQWTAHTCSASVLILYTPLTWRKKPTSTCYNSTSPTVTCWPASSHRSPTSATMSTAAPWSSAC